MGTAKAVAGDEGKAACVNLSHLTQMQYDKLTLLNITQPPKMAVEKSRRRTTCLLAQDNTIHITGPH